jgi:hypothetical protein
VQTLERAFQQTKGRDPATGAVAVLDVPCNGDGGSPAGGNGLVHACQAQTEAVLQVVLQSIRVLHELWVPRADFADVSIFCARDGACW